MTLMVTDADRRLSGTLTDGDIRRAIIAGATLDDAVTTAMQRNFTAVSSEAADVVAIKDARYRGIRLLPVLDSAGRIAALLDLHKTTSLLPMSAVIMAGGKGERLRPLTLTTPKPLIEVGSMCIIDRNIAALASSGITDIAVSVNYMADKMQSHFSEPVAGVSVKCFREETPLGTIGALAEIAVAGFPLKEDTLVMNSDLLTDVSFEDMYLHHRAAGADITIGAIPYTLSVPFAILHTDGADRVNSLEEKPTYSYYANAGIYIINNKAVKLINRGLPLHATQLIERAIEEGLKVSYFPINGTWIDIGTPADLRHARELMKYIDNQ